MKRPTAIARYAATDSMVILAYWYVSPLMGSREAAQMGENGRHEGILSQPSPAWFRFSPRRLISQRSAFLNDDLTGFTSSPTLEIPLYWKVDLFT